MDIAMPPKFTLRSIGRSWGPVQALKALTLTIEPGERVAILGPSGGGKSTLLSLLGGCLQPTDGELQFDGQPLSGLSPKALRAHRRRCGWVHQGHAILPQLSVHQNVLAGLVPQRPWWWVLTSMFYPLERERIWQLLLRVGLEDRQWALASVLSGGQQQRVSVARALLSSPSVFLVDEPTASLDPALSEEIANLLLEEATRRGATLLWCTHKWSLLKGRVERVLGLRAGVLQLDVPATEITTDQLTKLYQDSEERVL